MNTRMLTILTGMLAVTGVGLSAHTASAEPESVGSARTLMDGSNEVAKRPATPTPPAAAKPDVVKAQSQVKNAE